MREVATLAGVAMSSVSRVLSGHPDVSADMRARVLATVEELGYEPDFLAQSLRRGATLSVGFVVGDISNPLFASLISGAESVLRAAGYSMLVMNSENDPALDAAHIGFFQSRRVDGMILSLASERKHATLDELAQLEQPVVVIDRDLPARLGASAVLSDHRFGMGAAIDHLVDLGHRRIGLVAGPAEIRPGRERLAGFREALARRGLADRGLTVTGPFSPEHGDEATESMLADDDPPTAIIAGGNQLLAGCLRAMARHRLIVGREISLVTCDEVPLTEFHEPPIAAIARDSAALGGTAADLLMRRISTSSPPETVVLATSFVPRASCGPAPGADRSGFAAGLARGNKEWKGGAG
jgi:LacI family transcriptional regulator